MSFPPDPKCLGAATVGGPAPVSTLATVTLADNLTIGSDAPVPGFRCGRCGQSLLHSQVQAGSPVRGFWVTMENGQFGFDCPAGPGGHEPRREADPPPHREHCETLWEFDVSFDVMCTREPGHEGLHTGHVSGNGDVEATITWSGSR